MLEKLHYFTMGAGVPKPMGKRSGGLIQNRVGERISQIWILFFQSPEGFIYIVCHLVWSVISFFLILSSVGQIQRHRGYRYRAGM